MDDKNGNKMNARYEVMVSIWASIVYTFADLGKAMRFAETAFDSGASSVMVRNEYGTVLYATGHWAKKAQ